MTRGVESIGPGPQSSGGRSRPRSVRRLSFEHRFVSHQIPTENQRGGTLAGGIIARPPTDLSEAGTSIKPARRLVAFIHFEENRACAESRKTAQMQIEQLARQSLAAAGGDDGDREDLRFLKHAPRHDEPSKAASHH